MMLTNKEAITLLKTLKIYHNGTYAKAIYMAIEALQQTAWIPVEERLPDIDQSVLICTKYGEITDGYRWNEKDWFCAWGEYNGAHVGGEYDLIVAWMPLPEPYKGGDNND